ncbi:MAG: pilus assembly protein N-terminal domain-containing protein [Planctomycetota bacterium]
METLFHTTVPAANSNHSVFGGGAEAPAVDRRPAVERPARPAEDARSIPTEDRKEPAAVASRMPQAPMKHSAELSMTLNRSKTLRTKLDVVQAVATDPSVCDVTLLAPRAVSIAGKSAGSTHVRLWFRQGSHQPVTCLVHVTPDS